MRHELYSSKFFRGTIGDVGGAPEDMACGGMGGGKTRPLQVADCCGDHPAGVCDW